MRKLVVAGVVVALTVAALVTLGGNNDSPGVALADAAERIDGESMRQRVLLRFGDTTGRYEMAGEGVTAADNSSFDFNFEVKVKGEPGTQRMRMRNIGDDFWFCYRGEPQCVHSVEDAGPASMLTPSQFARFLSEADDVSEVGEERILGRMATHYQGTVDLEELFDEVGGESEERVERLLDRSSEAPEMGVDAYIAEDGLPVRLRMWAGETDFDSFDQTIDILEYGVPVDVQPPPDSRVVEEG